MELSPEYLSLVAICTTLKAKHAQRQAIINAPVPRSIPVPPEVVSVNAAFGIWDEEGDRIPRREREFLRDCADDARRNRY